MTKPTNTEYTSTTWETWKFLFNFFIFIFVQNPSIEQQLSQQNQHHTPSMELPMHLLVIDFRLAHSSSALHLSIYVPTYMHNTRA